MEQQKFLKLLQSLNLLSSEQTAILHDVLPEFDTVEMEPGASQVIQAVADNFAQDPVCPYCETNNIGKWGNQSGYPRYRCNGCLKTFNAMTNTPLARIRIKDKVDKYIDCMRGDMTLRTAAKKCAISLPASFLLRHRLMAVMEPDKSELLTGITEIDETFFRESCKGQRSLDRPARKRGARSLRGHGKKDKEVVTKIPVMVACDRQNNVTDAVLEHVSTDELESHLSCRIQPNSILCADALLSHESLAKRLNLRLKELVTSTGVHVLDGIYHIQHVNAYHSDLKTWINGFFKGVATKNLSKYLGWKRYLKTEEFSEETFLERISGHWVRQLLS